MNKKYCRYITYELQKQNADSMEVQMLSRPISFINFRIHVRLEKTPHQTPTDEKMPFKHWKIYHVL